MNSISNHPVILVVFSISVMIMLLLDLGVFNKKSHTVSTKEALLWTVVWISLSMAFSGLILYFTYAEDGYEKFAQFQSAYWIEKALSVDNLFVFILVFGYFNVPSAYHHKILFWGIIGALVMRALFIFSGVWIINLTYLPAFELGGFSFSLDQHSHETPAPNQFHRINAILTIFGFVLVYAGIKSWFVNDDDDGEKDFSKSPGAQLVHNFFKVSKEFDKDNFFTIQNGIKMATPLFVVLAVIEFTDLIFAVDSIPAIFSIAPDDPFILYTSNIFAILGLRSLYFLLANFIHMFSRLKYGLAIILSFIGIKMIISPIYHISSPLSLSIVGSILVLSLLASVIFPEKPKTH